MRNVLLGRDRELEMLRQALEEASEPGARVVVVRGEAGIGKSLLLERFLSDVEARGCHVVSGRADPTERSIPYAAWHHALARLTADATTSAPSQVKSLADAITFSADRPGSGASSQVATVFEAAWRLLGRLVEDGPVVVAVDDLHAADEDTLALLGSLARRLVGLPVLLAVTLRANALELNPGVEQFLVQVTADCRVSVVDLGPLGRDDVEQLLTRQTGSYVAPQLVDSVLERSGGNAFFASELGESLRLEGAIGSTASAPGADRQLTSPGLSIIRRVLPWGTSALRLARVLSALGEVPVTQVAAAGEAAGLSAQETQEAFDGLVRAQLLTERSPELFGFRHEILRESLYADLGPAERQTTHAALTASLQRLRDAGRGVDLSTIARHAVAAAVGPDEEAARLAQAAGDEVGPVAPRSAARWYETAVELTPRGNANRWVRLARHADALMRAHQIRQAIAKGSEALEGLTDEGERVRCLSVVVIALARCGDAASEGEALRLVTSEIDRGVRHPRLLMARSAILTVMGRITEAAADVDEARNLLSSTASTEYLLAIASAVRIAETQGQLDRVDSLLQEQLQLASRLPRHSQHYSYGLAAQLLAHESRLEPAESHLLRAAELKEQEQIPGFDERIEMASALVDFYRGRWDAALDCASNSGMLLAETGVSACLPYLEFVEVTVRASRGDIPGARQALERLSTSYIPALSAVRSCTLGWLELLDRRPGAAYAELEGSLDVAGDMMTRVQILALLARAAHALGESSAAADHLARCAELEQGYAVPRTSIELRLARAEITGDIEAARQAYDLAVEAGMPFYAAQALLQRGQLDDEPEMTLSAAWREFRGLGAEVWKRRAAAALRSRGLPVPRTPRQRSSELSEVERDIVRLVVEGLSNQEIADRLSYSKHTINAYLTRIYARTGCTSRFDLLRAQASGELVVQVDD